MGAGAASNTQSLALTVALWQAVSLNGMSVASFAAVRQASIGRAFVLEGGALRSSF
jgi:formyltetrahydrofolate synthetase